MWEYGDLYGKIRTWWRQCVWCTRLVQVWIYGLCRGSVMLSWGHTSYGKQMGGGFGWGGGEASGVIHGGLEVKAIFNGVWVVYIRYIHFNVDVDFRLRPCGRQSSMRYFWTSIRRTTPWTETGFLKLLRRTGWSPGRSGFYGHNRDWLPWYPGPGVTTPPPSMDTVVWTKKTSYPPPRYSTG